MAMRIKKYQELALLEIWAVYYRVVYLRLCIMPLIIKPTKTRRELHAELQAEIEAYLEHGGQVAEIPQGVSGRPLGSGPLFSVFEGDSHENRTLVNDVVAAIESRRKTHSKPPLSGPKKRVILDDFGQPIRWEWVHE